MKIAFSTAIKLSVGILLFIGLPLVGWGLGELKGFLSHPARAGYIVLLIILQAVAVIRFPGVGESRNPGKKLVSRQRFALMPIQILRLGIVFFGPYFDQRHMAVISQNELVRYFGLVVLCVGFVGMLWAGAVLGRMFSVQVTIQEGHQLITHGPYRYLRHPRYLGCLLFFLGIGLVFRSWVALMLVLAITMVLFWRIHDEENLLSQEFGAAWEAYRKRSWRLIPLLY